MSELASGPAAFFAPAMFLAFLSLAFPLILRLHVLRGRAGGRWICAVAAPAASAFIGAGIFPLDAATESHVSLVGAAFIAAGLTMYGLPVDNQPFEDVRWRWFSRGLLILFAGSTALRHRVFPPGIAQWLATAMLLVWFVGIGMCLIRSQ
jgi:hypothetical protein